MGELGRKCQRGGNVRATALSAAALFTCVMLLWCAAPGAHAAAGTSGTIDAHFERSGNLRLEFPESMQTWDNRIEPQAIRLTPGLPVQCTWTSDTRIDCGFDDTAPPAPATRYRIHLAAGLRTQSGRQLPAQTVEAETARPMLHATLAGWRGGTPLVHVRSNVPVSAEAVAQVLQLTLDGQPVPLPPLRELRRQPPQLPGFVLDLSEINGQDRQLELTAAPGLRSTVGPLPGTASGILLRTMANERFRLRGGRCDAAPTGYVSAPDESGLVAVHCTPGEPMSLMFSGQLDAASRQRLVDALPPEVTLTGWSQRDGNLPMADGPAYRLRPAWVATLVVESAGVDTLFELPASLRSVVGVALSGPSELAIRTGAYRPAMRAHHARALIGGETAEAQAVLARVQNTRPIEIGVTALGNRWQPGRFQSPPAGAYETRVVGHPGSWQVLGEGGWVRWTPERDDTARHYGTDLEFAAPGFDLFAVAGRREVLAWANHWDGTTPVADALVELLWLDGLHSAPSKVATARTGPDGVARLRLPDGFTTLAANNATWVLRATAGRGRTAKRAVLPAWQAGNYGAVLGQPIPTRLWGVADRPLYRAGDTVRYRLWQRDRVGGRLLRSADPEPVDLFLLDREQHKVIHRWEAAPGPLGGFSGELELPIHLTDSTYCIGTGRSYDFEGTCFFVGTYRAQDLWVQAQSRSGETVLRDGDHFSVEVEAGYYSGGPAADLELARVTALLHPMPLQSAYPEYRDYQFIDVHAGSPPGGISLVDERATPPSTDAQGRALIELPLAFDTEDGAPQTPAFGLVQLVAEARLSGREGSASNAATARYASHDRFVGFRMQPRWLGERGPIQLQGVVIDANGNRMPDSQITVEVHYLPGFSDTSPSGAEAQGPELLARCAVSGPASPCDFPRERSGRYRLTASSEDAASAELVQYVWGGHMPGSARSGEARLEILGAPEQPGSPVRLLLTQPHGRARALVLVSSGDSILDYRIEDVAAGATGLELPTGAGWRGSPVVHAFVREAAPAQLAEGIRTPQELSNLQVKLELPRPVEDQAFPVSVAFDQATAAPGDARTLVLHNASHTAREVVLAVVDDALRALATDLLPYFDPEGPHWLGKGHHWRERVQWTSFGAWAVPRPWWLPLDRGARAGPEDPPVVFDSPSPMDAPAPPPAPPAPPAPSSRATALDEVHVTGSRLTPADILAEGAPHPNLRQHESPHDTGGRSLQVLARVRTRFADAALWMPDIVLAPGETRELALTLPDNLTRWRALAWSSDADDEFHLSEAVLEAGLPLEARLQAPVRIYPGDRTRLAGNLRQTGDTHVEATGMIRVDGAGEQARHVQPVSLGPRGQAAFALDVSPREAGTLRVIADAQGPSGTDAVASTIEVASPTTSARRVQAGWIGDTPIALELPPLPASASAARLRVSLLPGLAGLTERWTSDLHTLQHRSWEHILSRAVGAALALERGDATLWPEARETVEEAVRNAAVFQARGGDFQYFPDSPVSGPGSRARGLPVSLTAYALQAFEVLREAGYPLDPEVETKARMFLEGYIRRAAVDTVAEADELAIALAAVRSPDPRLLAHLYARWPDLSLPGRIALARALRSGADPRHEDAVAMLLAQAPARGLARMLLAQPDASRWMGSQMREQCALIDLLGSMDGRAHMAARRGLIAGLDDLYAGGVARVDSQSAAVCLMALRDLSGRGGGNTVSVVVQPGDGESSLLTLPANGGRVDWMGLPPASGPLHLRPEATSGAPASYVAELEYQEDARQSRASSVGLSIERRYEVLRSGRWVEAAGHHLRENDWLRISLVVRTGAPRYFVAVTDAVPGGLSPTDLALGGIAGLDLEQVSSEGSWWFTTRRLDSRAPRFYAEYLPAGEHVLHYFARAANAGDYLSAPAVAELMYGEASRARTNSQRIGIHPVEPAS